MADKTLIDRDTFKEACEATGTCEVHENYQYGSDMDQICVGFTCSGWREAFALFIELASRDAKLATDMADRARWDSLGFSLIIYFPGFDIEEDENKPGVTFEEDPIQDEREDDDDVFADADDRYAQ